MSDTRLSLLLVEDEDIKASRVLDVVEREVAGRYDVQHVKDLSAAREALRSKLIDVMILDIAVPSLPGRPPDPDGGTQLLEDIENSRRYHPPRATIGLTAYDDVFQAAAKRFSRRGVSLIRYDPASTDWEEAVASRIWFALKRIEIDSHREFETDLAIVCALPAPELTAVLANGWEWSRAAMQSDPTVYHTARFMASDGQRSAVAASACQMGLTATAVLAMKMIVAFRPRYIAMVGITAAREGRAQFGDILVANPAWDWGAGKLSDGAERPELRIAPAQIPLKPAVRERLQLFAAQQGIFDEIRRGWPSAPDTVLRLRVGPVASGSAVVENCETMQDIERQHRQLLGVEMEGYAVHVAAEEAPEPQPTPFVMKSVVDFGVTGKVDTWHSYASYTSAVALRRFAEGFLWT